MPSPLATRIGPLAERDYRLLFSATTVTTLGDALAAIALAFAVLEVGSSAGLGIVLAARQGVEVVVLVFGAVVSDRLPRNFVLICFGVTTFAYAGWLVLGPVVANEELGGAGAWAVILSCAGAGAVVGGSFLSAIAPPARSSHPLSRCCL